MRNFHTAVWRDQNGTTMIEFAIIAPAFILFMIGILYLCMALFMVGSLHYAVEDGARCASIRNGLTQACKDETGILAYTQSRYFGPSSSPTFTYSQAACGNSVSANANLVMNLGFAQFTVPVTATACFP